MQRRQFLLATASIAVLGSIGAMFGYSITPKSGNIKRLIVSAAKHKNGQYFVIAATPSGHVVSQTQLPKRAHDTLSLTNKSNHVLVFARRPDTFAIEVNVITGEITRTFKSQKGRHFYGHGALSQDGRFLFTTENDFVTNRGLIVVRDTQNYQVVSEFNSGGIGPHQIKIMPGGNQLVVANGGIQTHPRFPRMKLNIDTMAPNLAYLDVESGEVVDTFTPPHHQQSIRHIDVNEDGVVLAGIQFQGDKNQKVPLVYSHKGQDQLQAMQTSNDIWANMRQYTASVIVSGNSAYVTCPRGDEITHWDLRTHTLIAQHTLKDVAGATHGLNASDSPIFSSGLGILMSSIGSIHAQQLSEFVFDNHMTSIVIT